MLRGASSCSEACHFSEDRLRLWLQSVQNDLQHHFAWVANETDRSVVLALLQVAFLGNCCDLGLGQRSWPFSSLPNLVTDGRESVDYVLSTCLDQFCWDVSTPADFHFFSDFTAASTSLRRVGCSSSVCLLGQFNTDDCTSKSSILPIGSVSVVLLLGIFLNDLGQQ